MIIGVPTEVKDGEFRVAVTPAGAHALVSDGHRVVVQAKAGEGSAIADHEYIAAGAEVVASAEDVWEISEMVMKVKEPIESEYALMRPDQVLFTYLHLASSENLTKAVLEAGVTGVAYETVQTANGHLPLLEPMSEVAGKMATQVAAQCLQKHSGGRGVLMGGVTGVAPAEVVVVGCGVVGACALKVAIGMGAHVSAFDINTHRLAYMDDIHGVAVTSLYSNSFALAEALPRADVVIGAVLIPGARAPELIKREMIASMRPGAVVVDVAIDQGGCIEDIKPTTHSAPTYVEYDVVHYAVTNIPAAVPRTSTWALTNATLPYARQIAGKGLFRAMEDSAAIAHGLNCYAGELKCPGVVEAFPHLAS